MLWCVLWIVLFFCEIRSIILWFWIFKLCKMVVVLFVESFNFCIWFVMCVIFLFVLRLIRFLIERLRVFKVCVLLLVILIEVIFWLRVWMLLVMLDRFMLVLFVVSFKVWKLVIEDLRWWDDLVVLLIFFVLFRVNLIRVVFVVVVMLVIVRRFVLSFWIGVFVCFCFFLKCVLLRLRLVCNVLMIDCVMWFLI